MLMVISNTKIKETSFKEQYIVLQSNESLLNLQRQQFRTWIHVSI